MTAQKSSRGMADVEEVYERSGLSRTRRRAAARSKLKNGVRRLTQLLNHPEEKREMRKGRHAEGVAGCAVATSAPPTRYSAYNTPVPRPPG
ncbi:hypothetical protein RTBOTA2_002171 [Rhodotorula toruloides]|nr:hypothetical protein RTBOTA2_002171 [Rhodotorula toruloides]